MPASRSSRSGPGAPAGRHRRTRRGWHCAPDAGHEAVGQALLVSIGLAGMLAATRLAAASMDGITVLINALH